MGLRTVDLEEDLTKLLDRCDFENVACSPDAELSKRVRKTLEEWKEERRARWNQAGA